MYAYADAIAARFRRWDTLLSRLAYAYDEYVTHAIIIRRQPPRAAAAGRASRRRMLRASRERPATHHSRRCPPATMAFQRQINSHRLKINDTENDDAITPSVPKGWPQE